MNIDRIYFLFLLHGTFTKWESQTLKKLEIFKNLATSFLCYNKIKKRISKKKKKMSTQNLVIFGWQNQNENDEVA